MFFLGFYSFLRFVKKTETMYTDHNEFSKGIYHENWPLYTLPFLRKKM